MNWRDIDVTTEEGLRALDQEIAERLGWTEFHTESHWFEDYLVGPYEAEMLMGAHPVFNEYRQVPYYSIDADAALELVEPVNCQFVLRREGDKKWRAEIHVRAGRHDDLAVTPALAICMVWLAWHDKRRAQEKS